MIFGTRKIKALGKNLNKFIEDKEFPANLTPEILIKWQEFVTSLRETPCYQAKTYPFLNNRIDSADSLLKGINQLQTQKQHLGKKTGKKDKPGNYPKKSPITIENIQTQMAEMVRDYINLFRKIIEVNDITDPALLVAEENILQKTYHSANRYLPICKVISHDLKLAFPKDFGKDAAPVCFIPNQYYQLDPIVHPPRILVESSTGWSSPRLTAYRDVLLKHGHAAVVTHSGLWIEQLEQYHVLPEKIDSSIDPALTEALLTDFKTTFTNQPGKYAWKCNFSWNCLVVKGLTQDELRTLKRKWFGSKALDVKTEQTADAKGGTAETQNRPIITFPNPEGLRVEQANTVRNLSLTEAKAVLGPWSESLEIHHSLIETMRNLPKESDSDSSDSLIQMCEIHDQAYGSADFIIRQHPDGNFDAVFSPRPTKPAVIEMEDDIVFNAGCYQPAVGSAAKYSFESTNIVKYFSIAPAADSRYPKLFSLEDIHFAKPALRSEIQTATAGASRTYFGGFKTEMLKAATRIEAGQIVCVGANREELYDLTKPLLLRNRQGHIMPPYSEDATGLRVANYHLKIVIFELPDGQLVDCERDFFSDSKVEFYHMGDSTREYRYMLESKQIQQAFTENPMTYRVKVQARIYYQKYSVVGINALSSFSKKEFLTNHVREFNALHRLPADYMLEDSFSLLSQFENPESKATETPTPLGVKLKEKPVYDPESGQQTAPMVLEYAGNTIAIPMVDRTSPSFDYHEGEDRLWCFVAIEEEKRITELAATLTTGGLPVLVGLSNDNNPRAILIINAKPTPEVLSKLQQLLSPAMYQEVLEVLPPLSVPSTTVTLAVEDASSNTTSFATEPALSSSIVAVPTLASTEVVVLDVLPVLSVQPTAVTSAVEDTSSIATSFATYPVVPSSIVAASSSAAVRVEVHHVPSQEVGGTIEQLAIDILPAEQTPAQTSAGLNNDVSQHTGQTAPIVQLRVS